MSGNEFVIITKAELKDLLDDVVERVAKMRSAEREEVLTRQQVADLMNLSSDTVTKLVHERELLATKIGSEYRFLRSEVIEWMRTHPECLGKKGKAA